MNSSYPHHHSFFHSNELLGKTVRPVCAYCLHWIGNAPNTQTPGGRMRNVLDDSHECVEKVIARQPHVALPFN